MSNIEIDLKNYIEDFEDKYFGNLEDLGKNKKYSKLVFKDSFNKNYGFSFIIINSKDEDEKSSIIGKIKKLIVNAKYLEKMEDIFKMYYFLYSLDMDLHSEERKEIFDLFFKKINIKERELLRLLIEKINETTFFSEIRDDNIFELASYMWQQFYGDTIVSILDGFYCKNIFPEIYSLKEKYFLIYLMHGINMEDFLRDLDKNKDKEKNSYRAVVLSKMLDRDLDKLSEKNKKSILKFLKKNWKEYGKDIFMSKMTNEFTIKSNKNFGKIFKEIVESFIKEGNKNFLKSFLWGEELGMFISFLFYYKREIVEEETIKTQFFFKFKNNLDEIFKDESKILKHNFFFKLYDKNSLYNLLKVFNLYIFSDEKLYEEWKNIVKKLLNLLIEFYYSNEFEIILKTNSLVGQLILLHIINGSTEEPMTIKNIKSSLKEVQGELLFKFLEKTKREVSLRKTYVSYFDEYDKINQSMKLISKEKAYSGFVKKWENYSQIKWKWMEQD